MRLRIAAALLAFLAGAPQEAPDLVRALGSADPAERDAAYERLRGLGEPARDALSKAVADPDLEISSRARALLRRLDLTREFPPGFPKAFPGLIDQLATGDGKTWIRIYLDLAANTGPYALRLAARRVLADRAYLAAVTTEEKKLLCASSMFPDLPVIRRHLLRFLLDADPSLRSTAGEELGRLGAHEQEQDLVRLLAHADPGIRSSAADALYAVFGVDARPLLLPLLRDPEAEVRAQILYKLGEGGEWQAEHREILALFKDPVPAVRCAAASICEEWMPREAAALLASLLKDPDENVRRIAIRTVGIGRVKEAAPGLRILLDDPDDDRREEAARALGRIGDREAIPALLRRASEKETVWSARAAACEALGMLKAPEALETGRRLLGDKDPSRSISGLSLLLALEDWPSAPQMVRLLHDVNSEVFESALNKMVQKAAPPLCAAAAPLLRHAEVDVRKRAVLLISSGQPGAPAVPLLDAFSDAIGDVRHEALWGAFSLRPPGIEAALLKTLTHENADTRSLALGRYADLAGDRAAPALVHALDDPSPEVRGVAARMLGSLVRAEDVPRFFKTLDDPNDNVRMAAFYAISLQPPRRVLPGLRKLLDEPHAALWVDVIDTLSQLGLKEAVPDLLPLLKSERTGVRRHVLEALDRLRTAEAIPAVRPWIDSIDPGVRAAAVGLLGSLGARNLAAELRPTLSSPEAFVRIAAAVALGNLKDRESASAIAGLTADDTPEVRVAAAWSLVDVGAPDAGARLEALLEDEEETVRNAAMEALAILGSKASAPKILAQMGRSVRPGATPSGALALGRLDAQELVPVLRKRLGHRYWLVRGDAASALSELGCREAVADILPLLRSSHGDLVAAAAEAAGRLDAKEAIPLLRELLLKPQAPAQWNTPSELVEALVRLGAREAIPELLEQLRDTHPATELAALDALRAWRDLKSLPIVISLVTGAGAFSPTDPIQEPPLRLPFQVRPTGLGSSDTTAAFLVPEILADLDAREKVPEIEKMFAVAPAAHRSGTAQALCRLGSTAGVPWLLEEAELGRPALLNELNALRRPTLWRKLEDTLFPPTRHLLEPELWADLVAALGLRLDLTPNPWRSPSESRYSLRLVREWVGKDSLRHVASHLARWMERAFILEDDRLRVVTEADALAFWKSWWEESRKSEK